MASALVEALKTFESELKELRTSIKSETANQIGKKSLRQKAEELGTRWFSQLSPQLQISSFLDQKKVSDYGNHFQDLITISGPSNLKTRYLSVLADCIRAFRQDFILPLQTVAATPASQLQTLLSNVKS